MFFNIIDEDSPADDTDADSTYSPNKDKRSVLSEDDMISSLSDEEEDSRKREKRPKRNKQGRPKLCNIELGVFLNYIKIYFKQRLSLLNYLNTVILIYSSRLYNVGQC